MAGDSVLAVFETAQGAVCAALAIQEQISADGEAIPEARRLCFRVGVHLGDVIHKNDGTVYGEGVNIAARLQSVAHAGGIVVSESIRLAVRNKVSARFEALGEQPLKNISEPISIHRLFPCEIKHLNHPLGLNVDVSLPDKPSVAILAFTNMSGDPEQEYFTDGITEGVVAELSRFHELFVIAHNSSFSYKGSPADARTVARELGVRYVVEGSIRKAADRIRITVQLNDATTGMRLLAERYDRALEDIFKLQDEVTEDIVRKVAPNILEIETQRVLRRHPDSLRGYEIAVTAYAKTLQAHVKGDLDLLTNGIADARAALAVDPRSTTALAALAFGQWQLVYLREGEESTRAWVEGIAAADRLIEIDRGGSQGYMFKGLLQANATLRAGGSGHDLIGEALTNLRQAYELNPHNSTNLIALCYGENMAGNLAKSIEYAKTALRLSPRDPLRFNIYHNLSSASFCLGEYDSGAEYAVLGLGDAPNFLMLWLDFVRCQVGLGDIEKARSGFEEAARRWPAYFANLFDYGVAQRNPRYRQISRTAMKVAAGLEELSTFEALVAARSGDH